jgi:two-component sensor histidine kinase
VDGDEGEVPTRRIQPIGLITNELVINAAKHGGGSLEVSYRVKDGISKLTVCDQGEGLPANFDPATSVKGLGMKVVRTLAKQLNGRVEAHANPSGRGSCFQVIFPA